MSGKSIIEAISKIVGDKSPVDEQIEIEDYNTRPFSVQTRGVHAPAPDDATAIKSPLTEVSRVEADVYITVPLGTDTVHITVASQIIMTDADGREFVFNFSVPS